MYFDKLKDIDFLYTFLKQISKTNNFYQITHYPFLMASID